MRSEPANNRGQNSRTKSALVVAVGQHLRDKAGRDLRDTQRDRYRTAVAGDSSGHVLRDLLTQLCATLPDVEITEPARKRVSVPYPQDHPRCDFLRRDSLYASVH